MIIGEKIKKAIESSFLTQEKVAAHADMSVANLYKIYKRDSVESRYLVKIAEILRLPYSYFLDDDVDLYQVAAGDQVQQAANVGKNKQQISVGMDDCPQRLEALQKQYELLEKTVADKDMIIELLRGQKQG